MPLLDLKIRNDAKPVRVVQPLSFGPVKSHFCRHRQSVRALRIAVAADVVIPDSFLHAFCVKILLGLALIDLHE